MTTQPTPQLSIRGDCEPICPYCNSELPDLYLDKFLCPKCVQLIFRLISPNQEMIAFTTESQADQLRKEWQSDEEALDLILEDQETTNARFQREKERLNWKTGKKLNDLSVEFYLLFQDMESQRSFGNWEAYSNSLQRAGILSVKNKKYKDALIWFFESIYNKLHGPVDLRSIEDSEDLIPFNKDSPLSVYECIQMARVVAHKGKLKEEEIRDYFFQATTAGEKYIPLPMYPHEAWKIIKAKWDE